MSRVFWDTNIFIYLFEDYGKLSERAAGLRARMLTRGDQLLTSSLTLGEVLIKPLGKGDVNLCAAYEEAILTSTLLISFDARAAKIYAALRRDRALRPPDTIQLACAAAAGTDMFVTNDSRLQGKVVPGIQFISSLEQAPI